MQEFETSVSLLDFVEIEKKLTRNAVCDYTNFSVLANQAKMVAFAKYIAWFGSVFKFIPSGRSKFGLLVSPVHPVELLSSMEDVLAL